jgi:uncharacterized membrane protein
MSYYDFKPRREYDRFGVIVGLLSAVFPLLALLLARPVGPLWVVLAILALLVLRIVTGLGKSVPAAMGYAALAAAGALALLTFINADLAMRLYPVLMNAAMLAAFGWSLVKPPSMIERFARIVEPNLPESGVRYTRKVTWVWCAFFVVNGAIALWTALAAPLGWWAVYNGAIAYGVMGLILGVELIVRDIVRGREEAAAKKAKAAKDLSAR